MAPEKVKSPYFFSDNTWLLLKKIWKNEVGNHGQNISFQAWTHSAQLSDTVHRTPIKLHAAPDTIHAASQHHHMTSNKAKVVLGGIVGQVQVVGLRWPLRRHCIYLLYVRYYSKIVSQLSDYMACAGIQFQLQ